LVVASQRVRFLPDQVSQRTKEITGLTARLKELSKDVDVPKLVAENFATASGAARSWHTAGFFKL